MFFGRLTARNDTVTTIAILPRQWRQYEFIAFRNLCARVLQSASQAVYCVLSFRTTCNWYSSRRRLFRRILWTVLYSICTSELDRKIGFFQLRMNVCPTGSTSSSDLLCRTGNCLLSIWPVSLNCSCHLLMLLLSDGLTTCIRIHGEFGIMDSNGARIICAL
jgi:hypothetical protein